jgi:hypothetical protein
VAQLVARLVVSGGSGRARKRATTETPGWDDPFVAEAVVPCELAQIAEAVVREMRGFRGEQQGEGRGALSD